jgi:para-aminobenzoate synthetase component 1
MKQIERIIQTVNQWAVEKRPFFLFVDFEMQQPFLCAADELDQQQIRIEFPHFRTGNQVEKGIKKIHLQKTPVNFETYQTQFDRVHQELCYGNSFLTNLTSITPIKTDSSLEEIFTQAHARYKILFGDQWLCFSPETFIQIQEGNIWSFPMKGTIDASIPNAAQIILEDEKEMAEHYTIVDLIRNDLSQVASEVRVERFRYLDEIKTAGKNLLQVSSSIRGRLPVIYRSQLGQILFQLLPAGSVSGAPKKKTLEIIREAELQNRGFYTGVAFYDDGQNLDSCVLIRFIEKQKQGLVYRSGGGITTKSNARLEYQEMIDKIYVPLC